MAIDRDGEVESGTLSGLALHAVFSFVPADDLSAYI
jgi:hypothetical protein